MPAQKAEPHNAAKPVVVPVRGQRGQTHVISAALASLERIRARNDISKVFGGAIILQHNEDGKAAQ